MKRRGEPYIDIDGETIDERDVEALWGVAEHGSMHKAAAELGRSYSRIQQRITELEESLGPLVTRTRGGEGGGGSTLTPSAYELLAKFNRLRAEFSGLSRTEESVFRGRVTEREGMLATVETDAGPLRAVVSADGDEVQVSIRSDSVGITTPEEAPEPEGTSIRNQFQGTVTGIEVDGGLARITIDVEAETPLRALVTQTSIDTLDLEEGDEVVASFKATATRAVPTPD